MQISRFNSANMLKNFYSTGNSLKKQDEKLQKTASAELPVSFWGLQSFQSCGYRRPNIKNESLKKAFHVTKVLPSASAIKVPRMIQINNEDFAYKVSKDFTGRAEIEIKNMVDSENDWNDKKKDKKRTILKCNFDPKGMLVGGSLTNYAVEDMNINAEFKHIGREGRRLIINDEIYRPVNSDSAKWALIPDMLSRNVGEEVDLCSRYGNDSLISSLIELAVNRTSLQLLDR